MSWFSSAADRRGFLRGGAEMDGNWILSWSLGCATHDQREKRNDEFLHVTSEREGERE